MSNKKQHTVSQTEWEHAICEKILALIRSELFLDLRYLDVALSALVFQPKDVIRTLATDGSYLYYSREQLLRLYPKNPLFLNRAYLHSVLHCVFRHLWLRGQREPVIWNLACDICVEYTIDSMEKPCTKRILSRLRIDYYDHLKGAKIPVTAAAVYEDKEVQKHRQRRDVVDAEVAEAPGIPAALAFIPTLDQIRHQKEVEDQTGKDDGHHDRKADHGVFRQWQDARQFVDQGRQQVDDDQQIAEDGVKPPATAVVVSVEHSGLVSDAVGAYQYDASDQQKFHAYLFFR